jgi:hypothetical protein
VSKLDTRKNTKGRKQPAKKKKPEVPSAAAKRGAIAAESQAEEIAKRRAKTARRDIGPASAGELARQDAELGELRSARRRIELENVGLRSEVEELRGSASETDDEEAQQLCALLRAWDRASESAREKFMARNGLQRAAPSDDGLDIPECLRRSAL